MRRSSRFTFEVRGFTIVAQDQAINFIATQRASVWTIAFCSKPAFVPVNGVRATFSCNPSVQFPQKPYSVFETNLGVTRRYILTSFILCMVVQIALMCTPKCSAHLGGLPYASNVAYRSFSHIY